MAEEKDKTLKLLYMTSVREPTFLNIDYSVIKNGVLCIFVLTNYFVFLELVIQRRSASKSYDTCDSSPCRDTYFDKGWSEYKSGFGSMSNDYWIGLEQLYNLTNTQGQTWGLEVTRPKKEI